MKRKFAVIGLGLAFLLAGCQQQVTDVSEESVETFSQDVEETTKNSKDDRELLVNGEMSLRIPEEWKGKYAVVDVDEGFRIVQLASYEKDQDLGILVTFLKVKNDNSAEYEGVYAYTQDHVYQVLYPTDACYYEEDQAIVDQYYEMQEQVEELCSSLVIDADDVTYTNK